MAYFTGDNLTRKVKEWELTDLDDILGKIASGNSPWPGTVAISTEPPNLESLRIVIYSLLHKYGLKAEFIVKVEVAHSRIVLGLRSQMMQRRTGTLQLIAPFEVTPHQTVGAGPPEDLSSIFVSDADTNTDIEMD